MVTANNSTLAAAVDNNASEDNRGPASTSSRDTDPFATVKITADANADGKVDWQDTEMDDRLSVKAAAIR